MEISNIVTAMQEGDKNGRIGMERRQAGLLAIIARLYSLKGMGSHAVVVGQDGKQYPSPDVQLAVNELDKEIAVKYPYMTMSEVRLALESGVKGELDDQPTILNVANYCRWLSLYRHSAARLEALQAVANGIRVASHANLLDAGTIESRNEEATKKALEVMRLDVEVNGAIDASRSDRLCGIVYDYLRKCGQMEKPLQSTIDAAIEVARKYGLKHATPLQLNLRAKRTLLQFYLSHAS